MTVGFGSNMEAEARLGGLVGTANISTTLPLHLAMRIDERRCTDDIGERRPRTGVLASRSAHLDGLW